MTGAIGHPGPSVPRPRAFAPLWPEAIALFLFQRARAPLRLFRTLLRRRLHLDAEDLDPVTQVIIAVGDALNEVKATYDERYVWNIAVQAANRADAFQRLQLLRQIRDATGVDVDLLTTKSPLVRALIGDFATDNAALVGDLSDRMAERLADMVRRAAAEGYTQWDLAEQIADAFGYSDRRAAFIARDQIGKLYGQLDRIRQVDLGVTHFIWHTMRDARVRDSHATLEGSTFAWSDPPVNERGERIIPGSDYNCRCWAMPDLRFVDLGKRSAA